MLPVTKQICLEALILLDFSWLFPYSNSTTTNQFCLEIICYRLCLSFDSLIFPYYPACIS